MESDSTRRPSHNEAELGGKRVISGPMPRNSAWFGDFSFIELALVFRWLERHEPWTGLAGSDNVTRSLLRVGNRADTVEAARSGVSYEHTASSIFR
jgi:hypothetical protein